MSNFDSGSEAIDAPRTIQGEISFTYEATLSKGERVAIDQAGGLNEFQKRNHTQMKGFVEDLLTNGSEIISFSIDVSPRDE